MIAPDDETRQSITSAIIFDRQIQRFGIDDVFRQRAVFHHHMADCERFPLGDEAIRQLPRRQRDGMQQSGFFLLVNGRFLADQRRVCVVEKGRVVIWNRRDVVQADQRKDIAVDVMLMLIGFIKVSLLSRSGIRHQD